MTKDNNYDLPSWAQSYVKPDWRKKKAGQEELPQAFLGALFSGLTGGNKKNTTSGNFATGSAEGETSLINSGLSDDEFWDVAEGSSSFQKGTDSGWTGAPGTGWDDPNRFDNDDSNTVTTTGGTTGRQVQVNDATGAWRIQNPDGGIRDYIDGGGVGWTGSHFMGKNDTLDDPGRFITNRVATPYGSGRNPGWADTLGVNATNWHGMNETTTGYPANFVWENGKLVEGPKYGLTGIPSQLAWKLQNGTATPEEIKQAQDIRAGGSQEALRQQALSEKEVSVDEAFERGGSKGVDAYGALGGPSGQSQDILNRGLAYSDRAAEGLQGTLPGTEYQRSAADILSPEASQRAAQQAGTAALAQFGGTGALGSARSQLAAARGSSDALLASETQRAGALAGIGQGLSNLEIQRQNALAGIGQGTAGIGKGLYDTGVQAGTTARGQDIQRYGIDVGSADARYAADRGVAAQKSASNASLWGSVIGGAFSLFSDDAIKHNEKAIGELAPGINLYEYDNELTGQREVGVIAQEVAGVAPDFVTEDPATGLLKVDYAGLTKAANNPAATEAIAETQGGIDSVDHDVTVTRKDPDTGVTQTMKSPKGAKIQDGMFGGVVGGNDTSPVEDGQLARVTTGETVVNKPASDMFAEELAQMNDIGRQQLKEMGYGSGPGKAHLPEYNMGMMPTSHQMLASKISKKIRGM